ncbi:MAG: hypothetical protein LBG80_10535 [Bacteroidales bacterium]|jgi:hypothetical protein|nr:hypothetical protein [Bacteroidales bacterium]
MAMKNKIILVCIFLCNNLLLLNAHEVKQQFDSVDINKKISIWIEQDKEKDHIVKLFIRNEQLDSLVLRSSFTLNNPQKMSYVLIYSCNHVTELDSIICNWQEPSIEEGEILMEYSDRKVFIKDKEVVSFEIPIRRNYIETEVYFKVKLIFVYKRKIFIVEKETNKIYVKRLNKQ